MKILGIDYGTKNIGLAWADTTLGIVLPFGIVKTLPALIKLIQAEKVDKVVLGFPLGLNSQENKNTERVQNVGFEIGKATGLTVEYCDERFSSQAADSAGGGVSRDERSAMIILEGYLERNKK
ncbi:MAG: Holliday junction resolvase RuvX [Candidatus Magasanikbacteria bacterium]|nr:Holliday junction resolvase RuvX [Candidatus Magasanikbacteria bacterium]